MSNLNTKQKSLTHRVMVFGGPKTGKTQLVGELAEFYKLIWVDMENGYETLLKMPEEWKANVELISLKDTRSYPIAIETCLKLVKGKVNICEAHGKVACITCKKSASPSTDVDIHNLPADTILVFDSATQLTNSAVANITKGLADDYKMQTDDWGNLGKLMDIFYSHVQQATTNIVVISHETEAESEGKKRTLVPVSGSRNFARNVAKYFGEVVYCERKNKKHIFASSTSYNNNIMTGSRTDIKMEGSTKPSLLAIFKPEIYAEREEAAAKSAPTSSGGILDKLKKEN